LEWVYKQCDFWRGILEGFTGKGGFEVWGLSVRG
jgi:hypothetical protein